MGIYGRSYKTEEERIEGARKSSLNRYAKRKLLRETDPVYKQKVQEIERKSYQLHKEERRIKNREIGRKRYRENNWEIQRSSIYFELLEKQNNVCAVCEKEEISKNKKGEIKTLAVDHNHDTNKVRGLLCQTCNLLLGFAKDDIDILKRGIKYLEEADSGYMVQDIKFRTIKIS